ncbi:hypothetical protein KA005_32285 [bacterium]|nr:hypothetical protein [bacterium]
MANFIDFILDAQQNRDLALGFLRIDNAGDLRDFLENYDGIQDEEFEKIITAKKHFEDKLIDKFGDDYY